MPRMSDMASMSAMLYVNGMSSLDLCDLSDRSSMGILQSSLNSSLEPSWFVRPSYQILEAVCWIPDTRMSACQRRLARLYPFLCIRSMWKKM